MELTTTWLIDIIQSITIDKLKAQTLIQELEKELQQSDLMKRINKWKEYIKELEEKEIEIRNNGIKMLQDSWIDKFESNWVEVRLKTSPWKVIIEEESLIPDEFKKTTTTTKTIRTVDKKSLLQAIKEWEIIDWVKLEKEVTLKIKYM